MHKRIAATLIIGLLIAWALLPAERQEHSQSQAYSQSMDAKLVGQTTQEAGTSIQGHRVDRQGREPTPPERLLAEPILASRASRASKSLEIQGRVVDDIGSPVANFTIEYADTSIDDSSFGERERYRDPGVFGIPTEGGSVRRPFAACDGAFRLGGLSSGEWWLRALVEDDRSSSPLLVSLPPGVRDVVLVVPRSCAIAGSVVDQDGVPVAGAAVFLCYSGEDSSVADHEPRTRATLAGQFILEGIRPGTVGIMAKHPDYADSKWLEILAKPGVFARGVEIQLSQGGTIEGLVDSSLGSIADRAVSLFSLKGTLGWRNASTDAHGRFVFERVIPQDYIIELRQTDHNEPKAKQPLGVRKAISVAEGRTTKVVFSEPGRPIAVRGLVSCQGMPVEGLIVRSYSQESEEASQEVRTASDGRFDIVLPGAGEYRFVLSANQGSFTFFDRDVPDCDEVTLAFVVPGGALHGSVVNQEGRPLGSIPITAVSSGHKGEAFSPDNYRRMYTLDDGTFKFELLTPGTYTLRAPDGFQDDAPPPRVPYGRMVLADIVIESALVAGIELRLPEEGQIAGVVVDVAGRPVPGVWVVALDGRGLSLAGYGWETRTDSTGHFEIKSVAPGTCFVRARLLEQEATSPPLAVEAGKAASVRLTLR